MIKHPSRYIQNNAGYGNPAYQDSSMAMDCRSRFFRDIHPVENMSILVAPDSIHRHHKKKLYDGGL